MGDVTKNSKVADFSEKVVFEKGGILIGLSRHKNSFGGRVF
jgi:hypothetical protein